VSRGIVTAGAIFPRFIHTTVLGVLCGRPNHTLPTGGGASFAGLTIDQFQRRTRLWNTAARRSGRLRGAEVCRD